jgi:hypothetical protein
MFINLIVVVFNYINNTFIHVTNNEIVETSAKEGTTYTQYTASVHQWFSTFVRPLPGNFFFYKTRAWYRAGVRRLSNTVPHQRFLGQIRGTKKFQTA